MHCSGRCESTLSKLCRVTVTKALEYDLEKHFIFNSKARKVIVELNKICLNNAVTQYSNRLCTQADGITTGDVITLFHWQAFLCVTSGLLVALITSNSPLLVC